MSSVEKETRLEQIKASEQLDLAALKNFSDYTKTSDDTFPKGFKFRVEDVDKIMKSFLPEKTPVVPNDIKTENRISWR